MRSTASPRPSPRSCSSFSRIRLSAIIRYRRGGSVVAAGNPPEYNQSVREFDIVRTMDRVKYMEIEAELSVWQDYARRANDSSGCQFLSGPPSGAFLLHGEQCRRQTFRHRPGLGGPLLHPLFLRIPEGTRDRASFRRISPEREPSPGVFLSTTAGMRRRKRIRGWLIFSPESLRIHL